MPPKGSKGKKGKGKALVPPVLEPVDSEPAQEEVDQTTHVKPKKKKIVTAFTEQQKEEIIDFLMQNEILYSKRLAGFKDVNKKEDLWATLAAQMNTSVDELKKRYNSMKTTLGRLKKRVTKSGSGGETITDMNATERWVWDKFKFLIPHIETLEARNVASFAAATTKEGEVQRDPSTNPNSEDASSRAPTPVFDLSSPQASQTPSQAGSSSSRRSSEDRATSGELKKMLMEFMLRSTAGSGGSYFGKYVEETLSKLPRDIRREAEMNIMQELHRAQRMAEQNQAQLQPNQNQQTLFQQQPHQFQQAMWQPHPSQWPSQPAGPQPSVWGSQDRSYIQPQFPTVSMTSPIPPVINPQQGISGSKASTITTTETALPSTVSESFYGQSGPRPQNVGNVNPSPQLNPDTLAVDDETVSCAGTPGRPVET